MTSDRCPPWLNTYSHSFNKISSNLWSLVSLMTWWIYVLSSGIICGFFTWSKYLTYLHRNIFIMSNNGPRWQFLPLLCKKIQQGIFLSTIATWVVWLIDLSWWTIWTVEPLSVGHWRDKGSELKYLLWHKNLYGLNCKVLEFEILVVWT